ncbi:MAG: ATP-dependent acyl-CoA ligase [Solirubrobacteraceae bacterium]
MTAALAPALAIENRTVQGALARGAELWGPAPLLRWSGGERTYAQMQDAVARVAGTLQSAGVGPGDRVLCVSGNRVELLDLFLACGWLGASLVPINIASRGAQLVHMLTTADPLLLVAEAQQIEHLRAVNPELKALERVWCLDEPVTGELYGRRIEMMPAPGEAAAPHPARPGDTLAVLYTSGTTGPSKGVQCPHSQFYWWGILTGRYLEISAKDTLYVVLPMFHTNALNAFWQAMLAGATYSFGRRFSASGFWSEVSAADATVTYLLGSMVQILLKRPPGPDDRRHRVRCALSPATSAPALEAFRSRFGVNRLVDGYGSTETSFVFSNYQGEYAPACMGRPVPEFECKIVGEDDSELPPGVPGELLIRPREPFSTFTGYFRMPEATVAAWSNLWFHTGDRVVLNEDGVFQFVDRLKDSIRRRGENISSVEVEDALQSHPDVAATAVVPVASELGDDEVLAFITLRDGATPDPVALVRHCETRLAYFAIPRYIEFVPALPLTESGKIRKAQLRERGVGEATWDRERAGIELRR